jgi:integrase
MSVKYSYDKANGVYYFRKNGKKIAFAKTEEALTKKLMQLGKFSEVTNKSNLTVKDAFDSFLPYAKQNVAPTSYRNYLGYINNHLADEHSPFMVDDKPLIDYKIADLDDHVMDKILKTLKRTKHNVSATTIVHIYSVLKSAITYIYNENRKHFDINPSESKKAKISRPKKQVWCPNKELAREVLEAVDKYCNPDNALFTHLCSLGLRSSEVSPLKASDFFFNSPKPFVKITRVQTRYGIKYNELKNGEQERFVYIGARSVERIKSYIIRLNGGDWLFPSKKKKNKPRTHNGLVKGGIKKALQIIGKDSDWKGCVHALRHYYASIIIEVAMKEKKSFKWIPKQLGHKDLATTMNIYGHLIEADDDDIGDVIEQSLYY